MRKAPFTAEEIESINAYQKAGVMHPFTCGEDGCRSDLVATEEGLKCPDCDYTQDWVHVFMADGSWRPSRSTWLGSGSRRNHDEQP